LDETKLDGSLDTSNFVGNSKIYSLVASSNQAGAEVMLMVGGWANSGGFPEMAADPVKRLKFATELASFCVNNGVKGADIDWEFPTASEFVDFLEMMKVLRVEFDKKSLLLTIATGDQHYDDFPSATWAYTDWINIMAYDMNWVPANTKVTANHSPADVYLTLVPLWEGAGVPKEKIVLGLPFYGRGNNNRADAVTYASIYNANTPLASENIGGEYHFNGYNTIYNKTGYMLNENYGGVMVWAIDQDLAVSHSASLQGAIVKATEDAKNDKFNLLPITLDVDNMDDVIVLVNQDLGLNHSAYKIYNSKGIYIQNLKSGEEFKNKGLPQGVYYLINKTERFKITQ
jgi:chitinase